MGARGPVPAPTRVKLLRGETRPSRLNYAEPIPPSGMPRMPADMDADAKVVWRRVLRDMRHTGVIRAADADVLRCYCEAVAATPRRPGCTRNRAADHDARRRTS